MRWWLSHIAWLVLQCFSHTVLHIYSPLLPNNLSDFKNISIQLIIDIKSRLLVIHQINIYIKPLKTDWWTSHANTTYAASRAVMKMCGGNENKQDIYSHILQWHTTALLQVATAYSTSDHHFAYQMHKYKAISYIFFQYESCCTTSKSILHFFNCGNIWNGSPKTTANLDYCINFLN